MSRRSLGWARGLGSLGSRIFFMLSSRVTACLSCPPTISALASALVLPLASPPASPCLVTQTLSRLVSPHVSRQGLSPHLPGCLYLLVLAAACFPACLPNRQEGLKQKDAIFGAVFSVVRRMQDRGLDAVPEYTFQAG